MKTTLVSKNGIHLLFGRSALLLVPLLLACFGLLPQARAVCQEGCSNTNTFLGDNALINNFGIFNTAVGGQALYSNTNGIENTATGYLALTSNTIGFGNTANGYQALEFNTGDGNTAIGAAALENNTTGGSNIALGFGAGRLTTGNNNIDIGNTGMAGESKTIRIGTRQTHTATFIAGISGVTVPDGVGVIVGANGHLGTIVSSARFKDQIKPMDEASEAILALRPVTFRYKPDLDPEGIPQFGLVAEDVEKVNPDLVARDDQGRPYSVRYEAVNAMLLNEFLKEHGTVQELKSTAAKQEATIAELKKKITSLAAMVKDQAAQVQKVSDQLEDNKPVPQVVKNP
jgi:uncharacterized coiled-coil protein SlyX